jgi:hypothetical protein
MRVGHTELEYFIDYINKRIHLFDLDNYGSSTITNSIDPTFQQKLLEQENLLQDVMDFKWICYGTDGIVAEYRNYNFKYISERDSQLYQPYLEKLEGRKRKWQS